MLTTMMTISALASMAIVTQDQTTLRAAPRDSAAQQAVLVQGDALEVRGERMGYLQVYDYRRERAGFVRASQVRTTSLKPEEAPELLSIVRFLRDTPGSEALGISYAAAYLRAAPAEAITAEPLEALGSMAERLAARASAKQAKGSEALSAQIEGATYQGVRFKSYETNGVMHLCYDGDAFMRVFNLPGTPEQRARAALGLTRNDCIDPNLRPTERQALDSWRADVLDKITAEQFAQLPEQLKNRLHLRRAGLWSALAYQQARKGEAGHEAAQSAIDELAAVNRNELSDEDRFEYADAAIRVGASRWAAETAITESPRLAVVTKPGEQAGETCVLLVDAKHDASAPLAKRCTFGLVWEASANVGLNGKALALAVQPMETWRELWVFRRQGNNWVVAVLPPAAADPDLGYVEFAGWVPGEERMLLARETRIGGRYKRTFEVMKLDTWNVEAMANSPASLPLFGKWQDRGWKQQTVSVR